MEEKPISPYEKMPPSRSRRTIKAPIVGTTILILVCLIWFGVARAQRIEQLEREFKQLKREFEQLEENFEGNDAASKLKPEIEQLRQKVAEVWKARPYKIDQLEREIKQIVRDAERRLEIEELESEIKEQKRQIVRLESNTGSEEKQLAETQI